MIEFKTDDEKARVLEMLQKNMNEEFRATLQYICHRISAKEQHTVLADSFKSAALDEMSHILFFSDLITKYGGTPAFTQWDVDKSGDIKTMLESDIALERVARQRYSEQLAQAAGYQELTTILESVLSDEADHEEEFKRYLAELT